MLDEAIAYLEENHSGKYEIIIVDDQSSDATVKVALDKADEYKLSPHIMRIITLSKNRGKGGAVTHGLLHSRGKYSLFADADGATLFPDVKTYLHILNLVNMQPLLLVLVHIWLTLMLLLKDHLLEIFNVWTSYFGVYFWN